nr:M23 family metallopeptidase [Flexivirga aerilata]
MSRVVLPVGVVTATATVGGVAVAGLDPLQLNFGSTLAAERAVPAATQTARLAPAVASSHAVTTSVRRELPGSVSRDSGRPLLPESGPATPASGPASGSTSASASASSSAAQSPSSSTKPAPSASPSPTSSKPAAQWVCAIRGCAAPMVSGFGARVSPGGVGSTYHQGDDFPVPIGTSLVAMGNGTVVQAGPVDGLGVHVVVDYGGGVQIVYGHMSSVVVYAGQRVSQGQLVGYSGNTGKSTGPHLHLEVHVNGVAIDPAPWLRARGVF